MPKDTFLNLDEEKRQRFVQAAFEEFCKHDFQNASISQIVKKLGIAKGSVYQYFENKADLYLYLFELAQLKKAEYVQARPLKPGEDFFAWIEELWTIGLRFDLEHPLYTGFLYNIMRERDPVAKTLMKENRQRSETYFKQLFMGFQEQGILRQDVDLDFMVFFFTQSAQGLAEYMFQQHDQENLALVREGKSFMHVQQEEIMALVRQLSTLLRSGMMS